MNLLEHKDLIDNNTIHIATVNDKNNPNISVASDVRVLDKDILIISANEMVNTQNNIGYNPNVVITVFDKEWVGLRIFGEAKFYTEGEYYDFCNNTFFSNGEISPFGATKPKGAIVVKVTKIEELK